MTLTEAAFWTKRFGVIALGAFVIFIIVILILTIKTESAMLPQYMSANFACTDKREDFISEKLTIPSLSLADGSEMIFEIKTDTGKIDALPQIINVYQMDNPTQSLSAQANAKILANKMGFDPEAIIRKGTESYAWVDKKTARTLEINAKNLNFTMTSDSSYIRDVAAKYNLPTEQEAKSKAANALRSLGLTSSDYSKGNHQTTLININPDGSYSQAYSQSEAELIRVDFKRVKSMITIPSNVVGADNMLAQLNKTLNEPTTETKIVNDEKLNIYTYNTDVTFLNPSEGNISIYVGAEDKDAKEKELPTVYRIEYTYWPIQEDSCGTYELITPQTAIEKIQAGEGSLIYLNEKEGDSVVDYTPKKVKKFTILYVNLTYYESPTEQTYLQPVYVVSGEAILDNDTKADFDFYYPAINYDIVQDKIDLPQPAVEEDTTSFL